MVRVEPGTGTGPAMVELAGKRPLLDVQMQVQAHPKVTAPSMPPPPPPLLNAYPYANAHAGLDRGWRDAGHGGGGGGGGYDATVQKYGSCPPIDPMMNLDIAGLSGLLGMDNIDVTDWADIACV